MRRFVVLFLVLGLVLGSIATADAAKKKKKKKKPKKIEREVEGSYAAPATALCFPSQTEAIGCMAILSGAKEVFVTAKVTDAHGLPVAMRISADLDGDNSTETTYGDFCGETEEPIQIDPGVELIFWVGRVDVAATNACAPGVATQGTMTAVFSNIP